MRGAGSETRETRNVKERFPIQNLFFRFPCLFFLLAVLVFLISWQHTVFDHCVKPKTERETIAEKGSKPEKKKFKQNKKKKEKKYGVRKMISKNGIG